MTRTAPSRVFVHIGLHKTGTTYLQNVMRANREHMRGQDVDFPGGPGEPVQAHAVWDLQGRRPRGGEDRRIAGSWDALVAALNGSEHDTALVSEERLSLCTLKQVRKVVDAFPDSEVQVIVTARDLARVAVSAWQEEIKNDQTWTWREFIEAVKDPEQLATSPARGFWLRQDLAKICETWEAAVGAQRVHVVTVPQSGASPDLLLRRFLSVVGLDPSSLPEQPAWNNETVGVAATEVIRQVNTRLDGRLNQRQYDRAIKMAVVPLLAARTEPKRFALPPEELGWVRERADATIRALHARGYPVVGDLEELRPQQRPDTRRPDDASDAEILDAAVDALALLTERYATSWWQRKKPDAEREGAGMAARARGLAFKGQRKVAAAADRSPLAARAVGGVLRARDRARRRALDKRRSTDA